MQNPDVGKRHRHALSKRDSQRGRRTQTHQCDGAQEIHRPRGEERSMHTHARELGGLHVPQGGKASQQMRAILKGVGMQAHAHTYTYMHLDEGTETRGGRCTHMYTCQEGKER